MRLSLSFLVLLSVLVAPAAAAVPRELGLRDDTVTADSQTTTTYDFIIAGGGTAGISIGARLSENPAFNVLVIEAGPPPDSINSDEAIPGLNFFLEGSNLDWNFTTINQPTLNGRSFLYTRGKCIGGSSVINFLAFNRGSSSLYNMWEKLGNPGWNWTTVFPFFKKSSHFTPPHTNDNSQITYDPSLYDPNGGPVQISYGNYVQPYDKYWYPALQEIGMPKIQDFNGGNAIGVAHETTTINPVDESRSSAYTSFYASAKNRTNFHVLTNTMVQKILLNKTGSTTTAYGVTYKDASGIVSTAIAAKEVIVSAGAIQTPQLLMLSGIGPKAILDKFNIPAYVYNDGVGQRLQDHPSYYVNIEVPTSLSTIGYLLKTPLGFPSMMSQYQSNHTGPFASMNGDTIGFQRLSNAQLTAMNATSLLALGSNWPNLEYLMLPAYNNPGFPNPPNATGNYVTILIAMVSPTSLGSVSISSTNINDPPIIDVNYFATPVDQKVAVQGLKNALAVAQSNSFKPVFLGSDKVVPPPSINTDDQMLQYIRNVTTTIWHGSGTAAMLPQASGGVVDSQLRVYGVKNLRIADASIQPIITNQHIQAVVYMIAERAADFLKKQYS